MTPLVCALWSLSASCPAVVGQLSVDCLEMSVNYLLTWAMRRAGESRSGRTSRPTRRVESQFSALQELPTKTPTKRPTKGSTEVLQKCAPVARCFCAGTHLPLRSWLQGKCWLKMGCRGKCACVEVAWDPGAFFSALSLAPLVGPALSLTLSSALLLVKVAALL